MTNYNKHYLQQRGNVLTSVCLFVCPFVYSEWDCAESLQVIFTKPCRIIDYGCEKKAFNFVVDATQMATQPLWIPVIIYCIWTICNIGDVTWQMSMKPAILCDFSKKTSGDH